MRSRSGNEIPEGPIYSHRFRIRNLSFLLIGDEWGITRLKINSGRQPCAEEEGSLSSPERFSNAEQQLREYFGGQRSCFDLKLNPRGTPFQQSVWKVLSRIPYGELRSYSEVAATLGKPAATRAVGMANHRNPIPVIIPCHRVVGIRGDLTGYAGGLELKQYLIDLERISRIFSALSAHYGDIARADYGYGPSWWPAKSPFEMMVGAILTQNTSWKNVEKALDRFGDRLTPVFIRDCPGDVLADIIRPSGFFKQKALKLKALVAWFAGYGFDVDRIRERSTAALRAELLAINGVGPETADSILVYGLGKPSFVIDAYTRRIFSRLGFQPPDDYDAFRERMEGCVPDDLSSHDYYHGLIVEHAKAFCRKNPSCGICPLKSSCCYAQEPDLV